MRDMSQVTMQPASGLPCTTEEVMASVSSTSMLSLRSVSQTFQARFRREAQSAASLNNPSIVAVYDTGEDMSSGTPVPFIVMEFVDGRTVRDLLIEGHRLLPERTLEITSGVLRALEYSHQAGIVHRHDVGAGQSSRQPE